MNERSEALQVEESQASVSEALRLESTEQESAGRTGQHLQPESGPESSADTQQGADGSEPRASEAEPEAGERMQALMQDMEREYREIRRGDVVEGVVVSVDKEAILVDIGTKSEGIIPAHEAQAYAAEGPDQLKVGDQVLVYVVHPEDQDGHVVLSLGRARAEKGWRTVQKQFEEGQLLDAEVVDYNKGGLIVNVDGIRGFVPMSQVVGLRRDSADESELENKLKAMVGERIPLKVLELNRRRNRLILSERLAVQERRIQRKEQLLEELHEGEIRHGRVSSICDFGAFIDLGGADGLVHLSELAWGSVPNPSDVLQVGQEVDVYVLGVDREKKKIALSLRRAQPEPWAKVAEKYKPGDLVTGTITKLANFGAFARIEEGVEGLIHISELSQERIAHPRNVVKEGDVLSLRILRIDAEKRRLGLSLKQAGEPVQRPTE